MSSAVTPGQLGRNMSLNPVWVQKWEAVLSAAKAAGLRVHPVMAVWAEWNDGSGLRPGSFNWWHSSPFNAVNGGPAVHPYENFRDSSPCQTQWLHLLRLICDRWDRSGFVQSTLSSCRAGRSFPR
eukprot:m.195575 g.195575  ORF g.195575 m.195575 type:complete len:125 (+) comp15233_c0_seq1:250-624(+)